jgi:hypothetical protein
MPICFVRGQPGGVGADCGSHPLIHTFPESSWAQNVEKKKAEPKTPHFPSLNQHIVARSKEGKWGLKYVMWIFTVIEYHTAQGIQGQEIKKACQSSSGVLFSGLLI